MKHSWPYVLIIIGVFLGINGPSLFSEGMFMDGLIYSAISRNLAEGKGSFWYLFFSNTYFEKFHEHPPLAFGLQSIFFKVFGDNIYVERFYSFGVYLLSLFLMARIWSCIVPEKYIKLYWLPLFFFSIIGVVGWSVSNNMLENTMTVFVLMSFYSLVKSLNESEARKKFALLFLGGVCLFLGFLTKGFVALFPLISIVVYGVFTDRITLGKSILNSIIILIGLITPFLILYYFDYKAIESLKIYFEKQVATSIKSVSTVNSRFWIIKSFFQQLIPVLLLVIITLMVFKRQFKNKESLNSNTISIFIIGLSGVLPIIISLKQRDFYIVSAYPFIVFSFSLYLMPMVYSILERATLNKVYFPWLKRVSVLIFFLGITISTFQFGRVGRDYLTVNDVKEIKVPENSIIGIPKHLSDNWALRGYFSRYAKAGLMPVLSVENIEYYLSTDSIKINNYTKVEIWDLKKYSFYKANKLK